MNIIFAGTPEIAAHALQALLNSRHRVVAVYTQPDRPAGRGKHLQPSPVKVLAQEHDLPIYQPEKCHALEQEADIMVVVAYGLILPQAVLDKPRYGCINLHTSLLPQYRGAAPVQQAILNGETKTGVSIMQLDKGCDTGPVWVQRSCEISLQDTSDSLLAKLSEIGAKALLETLDLIESGTATAQAQVAEHASYAHKIDKQDGLIDWNQTSWKIHCAIRAYQPWPIAFTFLDNLRINILQAEILKGTTSASPGTLIHVDKQGAQVTTQDGVLNLLMVQLPGKKPVTISALLNGYPDLFKVGKVFHHAP